MALNVLFHLILTNIQSGIIIIHISQLRKWKIDKLSNLAIISQVITDGGRCWAHSSLFSHSISRLLIFKKNKIYQQCLLYEIKAG